MYRRTPLLRWIIFVFSKKTTESLRWRLSVMLSAGDKWITRLLWGRELSKRGSWWMESQVCVTPALLRTLGSGHLLWQKGRLACRTPPLEQSARARHWLMMNVSHDWEAKLNCICPQAMHHNNTPTSSRCSPTGTTVKSTVRNATVQMCGQLTEIPKSFPLPSTSPLQANIL